MPSLRQLKRVSQSGLSQELEIRLVPDARKNSFRVEDGDEDEYINGDDTFQQLVFEDVSYKNSLLTRLDTLRRNRELCDVVLSIKEREIHAHRVVLSALSPTFCEIFTGRSDAQQQSRDANGQTDPGVPGSGPAGSSTEQNGTKSGNHVPHNGSTTIQVPNGKECAETAPKSPSSDQGLSKNGGEELKRGRGSSSESVHADYSSDRPLYLDLAHLDYDSVQALVNYAYTSRLEIPSRKVGDLYKAASFLRVQNCSVASARYLADNLSPENCLGVRKSANNTNDILLASNVDAYIKENFSQIIETSPELSALPCIQVEVIRDPGSPLSPSYPSTTGPNGPIEKDEHFGVVEKILQYFQNLPQPPGQKEMRMEDFTGKSHLLFLDEHGLRDCCDVDDASSVGSSDMVQDYKRSNTRNKSGASSNSSGRRSPDNTALRKPPFAQTTAARMNSRFNSNESVNSVSSSAEIDEILFDVIAVTKSSNSFSVALAVMYQRLVSLFVQVLDQNGSSALAPNNISTEPLAEALDEEERRNSFGSGEKLTPIKTMNHPRCSCGAVNLSGKLVIADEVLLPWKECVEVIGGYDRGECMKSTEEYDPSSNEWRPLPPMQEERGRFDAAVLDGKVYALGGCNGNSDLKSVECYDPAARKWTNISPMLLIKSNNGCCAVNGKLFSIGGWNGKVGIRECERYDPGTGVWEMVAPMNTKRYQAGVCAWKGRILAVGGCDAWNCLNSVECYDSAANLWKPLPPMATPRRGCGVGVVNDKLYVVGGSDGTHSLSSVEVFDLIEGYWYQGPPMKTPRANVHCATIDDRLYAVGGFNGKTFLNSIEYLDQEAQEWRNWTVQDLSSVEEPEEACGNQIIEVEIEEEEEATPRASREENHVPLETPDLLSSPITKC